MTQPKNNLFMISSPLLRQAIIRSGVMRAASDELASRLAALCERFYLNREIEQLAEAAELLMDLPGESAQAAGRYYLALRHIRQGEHITAARLLESVLRCAAVPYLHARAIQSLGVIHRREDQHTEAARLYQKAASLARHDYITIIRAGMTLSDLCTLNGDHSGALRHLAAIRPAVEIAAQVAPVYGPMWCNNIAVDLAGLGRFEDARRFASYALASPYAAAYPEWAETAREIEAQAALIQNACAAVKRIRKTSPKPKLRQIKKLCPAAFNLYARRRTRPPAVIRPEQPRSNPIIQQISLKIRIRAPSLRLC